MTNPIATPRRDPPGWVKALLRQEVGYGCPVRPCASPYLEYHHFDPPWAHEQHHRPAGMIALCAEHHAKAGAGAFTLDQLRTFKRSSYALSAKVRGQFDWRRRDLVARVGGNFYLRTPLMIQVDDHPVVWQRRDDDGTLLLSLQMLTTTGEARLRMIDHEWYDIGHPAEFESPPSGRRIHARYPNGDDLAIEFWEATSLDHFVARYSVDTGSVPIMANEFPVSVADISMNVAGTGMSFTKDESRLGGSLIRNGWFIDCGVGIDIH